MPENTDETRRRKSTAVAVSLVAVLCLCVVVIVAIFASSPDGKPGKKGTPPSAAPSTTLAKSQYLNVIAVSRADMPTGWKAHALDTAAFPKCLDLDAAFPKSSDRASIGFISPDKKTTAGQKIARLDFTGADKTFDAYIKKAEKSCTSEADGTVKPAPDTFGFKAASAHGFTFVGKVDGQPATGEMIIARSGDVVFQVARFGAPDKTALKTLATKAEANIK